ncbi:MAG: hypothetical protein ABIO63_02210 [Casimicrobiaceae bacterium]
MSNQSDQKLPRKSKFNIDGSELVFGYCLHHGYTDLLFMDDNGNDFHRARQRDCDGMAIAGVVNCYGGFVHCEPPPPLTDEEWEAIFEQEATL